MNLAQDILRRSQGYIHTMPATIITKKVKAVKRMRGPCGKYFDEQGKPAFQMDIAKKYGVSHSKVKDLFRKYPYQEVYKLIGTDLRSKNGQGEVYALPCGEWTSAQAVADFYGVSRSVVQRAWTDHKKCPVKANAYLMDRFFVH